ncbi:Glycosyl transferase domain containing protein [Aphelenchoides fujianensis]|nr:Glycosyl transferase domain containing protein [Aphelenchoides fujianensis]
MYLRLLCGKLRAKLIWLSILKVCSLISLLNSPPRNESSQSSDQKAIVLYWHAEYFEQQYSLFVPSNASRPPVCPFECVHSVDRRLADEAAVRVFHQRHLEPADLPAINAHSLNVYYNLEPPYLSYSKFAPRLEYPAPPASFNETATYRSNSEVFFPYDLFVPRDGRESEDEVWDEQQIDEKIANKTRTVLIAFSNCRTESKREAFVDELERSLPLTRVGKCGGTVACEKQLELRGRCVDGECMRELVDSHFFYLAFENAVCSEYTTEKFWRLKELIVPVVLSRAAVPPNIPPEVFIAASDFESPAALAAHLRRLIEHPAEYRRHLEWTKKFRKTHLTEAEINAPCHLCALAHRRLQRTIADYKREWTKEEWQLEAFAVLKGTSAVNLILTNDTHLDELTVADITIDVVDVTFYTGADWADGAFELDRPANRSQTSFVQRLLSKLDTRELVISYNQACFFDEVRIFPGTLMLGGRAADRCKDDWTLVDDADTTGAHQWSFPIDKFEYGAHSWEQPGIAGFVLFSSFMVVPQRLRADILEQLNATNEKDVPCTTTTDFVFTIGGREVRIPPADYLEEREDGKCSLRVTFGAESSFFCFLPTVFKDHCILLDYDRRMVGLASRLTTVETNCTNTQSSTWAPSTTPKGSGQFGPRLISCFFVMLLLRLV